MSLREAKLVLIADTREQRPYVFDRERHNVEVVVETLKTGDYTARGAEHFIRIERKGSISDLAACVGKERERFERELERLLEFPRRFLLMEFTMQQMLDWTAPNAAYCSRHLHGTHLVGTVLAWSGRYGIHPIFAGSRALAAATLLKLLRFAAKDACGGPNASAVLAPANAVPVASESIAR